MVAVTRYKIDVTGTTWIQEVDLQKNIICHCTTKLLPNIIPTGKFLSGYAPGHHNLIHSLLQTYREYQNRYNPG